MHRSSLRPKSARGQTLVETALVLPLFLMVIVGIIVLGLGLFYQQQVVNAARETARYAAIHSATSLEPVCSWMDPRGGMLVDPSVLTSTTACDQATADGTTPANPQWPRMQAHGRQLAGFGFVKSDLHFSACWTGYTDRQLADAGLEAWDAAPLALDGTENYKPVPCTIGGIDPVANSSALPCPPPLTSATDDKASNLAVSSLGTANQVTVYACYEWRPPLAGFLLIPETVTLRATITQSMQHQR
jgi:hypothetical protein